MIPRVFILTVLLFWLGCDDKFNPVRGYTDRIVVYSILNPMADTQFVRLYSTYNAPGHNPANNEHDTPLSGATVRISDISTSTIFRDTLLPRPADSRYDDPLLVYVAPGFRPEKGREYLLEVFTPLGEAVALTQVPTASYVFALYDEYFHVPHLASPSQQIVTRSVLSEFTFAYMFRMFLEYEIAVPGGWEQHEIEIPLALSRHDTITNIAGVYPPLRKRATDPVGNMIEAQSDAEAFSVFAYRRIIQLLRNVYRPGVIRFLRVRIVLYQTDEDFYTYTKLAGGFEDLNTVRTDEPDFTNISGGRGLFSSVSRDTVSIIVSYDLGL